MAEEKKDAKKDDKKVVKKKGTTWEDVLLLIIGVVTIFFVIVPQLAPEGEIAPDGTIKPNTTNSQSNKGILGIYNNLFGEKTETIIGSDGRPEQIITGPSGIEEVKFRLADIFSNIFVFLAVMSVFLSALFGALWYYNSFRLGLIKEGYNKKIGLKKDDTPVSETIPADYVPDTNGLINPKWERVEKYYNSGNPSDWRIAIIEADILLFEVLRSSGFKGETIGEMLKNANTAQLQSLQIAWKSHLIRNKLAHEGASLQLTRHMVEEAIEGFRTVFTELNFI